MTNRYRLNLTDTVMCARRSSDTSNQRGLVEVPCEAHGLFSLTETLPGDRSNSYYAVDVIHNASGLRILLMDRNNYRVWRNKQTVVAAARKVTRELEEVLPTFHWAAEDPGWREDDEIRRRLLRYLHGKLRIFPRNHRPGRTYGWDVSDTTAQYIFYHGSRVTTARRVARALWDCPQTEILIKACPGGRGPALRLIPNFRQGDNVFVAAAIADVTKLILAQLNENERRM